MTSDQNDEREDAEDVGLDDLELVPVALERLAERVERTGPDVAEDDTERAERQPPGPGAPAGCVLAHGQTGCATAAGPCAVAVGPWAGGSARRFENASAPIRTRVARPAIA